MQHLLCRRSVEHARYGAFEQGRIYDVLPHVARRLKEKFKKTFANLPTRRVKDLSERHQAMVTADRMQRDGLER